jgi:hypothetical protein
MAHLTKAEAARQLGISRTTLYKLIDQGTLSATPDGLIDTAELVRIMYTVNAPRERPRPPLFTVPLDTVRQGSEHHERPAQTFSGQDEQTSSERQLTSSYRDLVDILREQLQAAQERERDYRDHIARLTEMLRETQQQNQRLLDMPRSAPVVSPAHAPQASRPLPAPRGEMRRRILALLRDHPEGLSPAQVRQMLGVDKTLQSTMQAMVRDGLLRRVAAGVYVRVEEKQDWREDERGEVTAARHEALSATVA